MNRMPTLPALIVASALVAVGWRRPSASTAAPPRSFVWLVGRDTIGRESFTRTGDALTGDIVGIGPWQRAHYEGRVSESGSVSRLDLRISQSTGAPDRRLTIVIRDDSAFVIEHSERYEDTLRLASKPNAVPMVSSPVAFFELVVQRALAQKTTRADVPVLDVPVGNSGTPAVVPFTVTFASGDTAVISVFGDEKIRFGIDALGHIRGGGSSRQHVTVVPSSNSLSTASSNARAQQSRATPTPSPIAQPTDVNSPDAILEALYEANSVMVDQKRGADRFRSLFDTNGRLISTTHGFVSASMLTRTVDEYVAAASAGKPRGGFSEREIARTSQSFGSIMHVFSTYESRRDSADTHPSRGINSIQLFNDGHRWWVATVLWDTERPNSPIPAAYLKSGPTPP